MVADPRRTEPPRRIEAVLHPFRAVWSRLPLRYAWSASGILLDMAALSVFANLLLVPCLHQEDQPVDYVWPFLAEAVGR